MASLHLLPSIEKYFFRFDLDRQNEKKKKKKAEDEKGGKMSAARIPDEFRLRFPRLTGRQAEMKTLFTVSSLITRSIVAARRKGAFRGFYTRKSLNCNP